MALLNNIGRGRPVTSSRAGFIAPLRPGLILWLMLATMPVNGAETALISTIGGYKVSDIALAIYKAEGGENAEYPFGIRSVKCSGYEDCYKVCVNTIRNNYRRWVDAGRKGTYLEFLAKRYCPVGKPGLSEAEQRLNGNWLKNVKWFLEKGETRCRNK